MKGLAIAILTAIAGGATFALANKGTFDFLKSGNSGGNPPVGYDNQGSTLPDGTFPLRRGGRSRLIQEMQLALLAMREDVAKHIRLTGGADGAFGSGTGKALQAAGYSSNFITAEDFASITNAADVIPDAVDAVIFQARGNTVNLRSCPSVNNCPPNNVNKSTILKEVAKGEALRFTGEKQREFRVSSQYIWYKVRTPDNIEGWVRNDVVEVVSGTLSGGLDGLDCVTSKPAQILAEGRSYPVSSNSFIGQVMFEHDGWVLVRLNDGQTGVIEKRSLKSMIQ